MGGHAYLMRLAFGRSAYEPVPPTQEDDQAEVLETEDSQDGDYVQRYDRKGNPINPEATRRLEAQIAAKNEVLAVVGVCERKDKEAAEISAKLTLSDEEKKVLRAKEASCGEFGRLVADISRGVASWWLVAVRKQIQAGLIASDQPFAETLTRQWYAMHSGGFRGALHYFTAGVTPELISQISSTILNYFVEEMHIRLCELPFRPGLPWSCRLLIMRLIDQTKIAAIFLGNLFLAPLAISSTLQQLGLMPSVTTSILMPWHPLTPLRWAYSSRGDVSPQLPRLLALLTSPAALVAISDTAYHLMTVNYGYSPFIPEYKILGPEDCSRDNGTGSLRFPFVTSKFKAFRPLATLRDHVLHFINWAPSPALEYSTIPRENQRLHETLMATQRVSPDSYEFDHQPQTRNTSGSTTKNRKNRKNRTTDLANLPSQLLASTLNQVVSTIIFLPLESFFLRSLISAFVASPLATRQLSFYAPGKGPVGVLLGGDAGPAEWRGIGNYVSKIGLCIALQWGIDAAIWGVAYKWARDIGMKRFYWGSE